MAAKTFVVVEKLFNTMKMYQTQVVDELKRE